MIETRVKMSAKFLKLNEVYEFIETLERQHKTKFVKQKCTKELEEINDFDNFKSRCDSKSIQWTSRKSSKDFQMEFDGKPFLITGKRLLECRFGPLRCSNENSKKVDHTYSDSKHTSIQTTRKLQCPAKIVVRQIVKFKDFTITRDSEWLRRAALIRLKAALVDDSYSFDVEIFYIVCYPSTEEHQNHYSGPMAESSLDVDDRVMTKMKELFDQGVKKVGEMRRRIRDYVESNLFQGKENPPQSDSRFWPSKKSIHNCLYRCQVKARLADDDLQNLIKNIPQWQKDGVFPGYVVGQQHDTGEFLIKLLDRISLDERNDASVDVIRKSFVSHTSRSVTCEGCQNVHDLHETNSIIDVTLPEKLNNRKLSIQDLINSLSATEQLQLRCTTIGCEGSSALAHLKWNVCPKILCLQLKRWNPVSNSKSLIPVVTNNRITISCDSKPVHYQLLSLILHMGQTATSGHYITLVKRNNVWIVCDDNKVYQSQLYLNQYSNENWYLAMYLNCSDEADENGINPVQTTDPSTDENFISDETIARLRKVRVKQIPRVADNANYNLRHTQRRDENYTALTAAIFYKDLNARQFSDQKLLLMMCYLEDDETDLHAGSTSVNGVKVLTVFRDTIKPLLTSLFESCGGDDAFISNHWRHFDFLNERGNERHVQALGLRDPTGVRMRKKYISEQGMTELAMLTLYEFFILKTVYDHESIYVPLDATFLTLRCCKNRQLMHLLENGGNVQRFNRGIRYAMDVAIPTCFVYFVSMVYTMDFLDADKLIYPSGLRSH